MKKSKLIVGLAVAAALAMGTTACSSGGTTPNTGNSGGTTDNAVKDLGSASILTNWFAQAEQGGYWSAQADGLAKALGVDLTVQQGGPGIQTIPQVAAGKADFGVGNADEIQVAVSNGLPIVAVAAGPAVNLQCLAYHKSTGITGFADLNGKTVARVPSPYWDFIKKDFKLDSVKEVNITGLANFQKDENMVLQCFITSEPYTIEKMGINDVGYLSINKDGGYNAYQNMLFTTQKMINEKPDLVKAVVKASNEGWAKMLADPTKSKALIMKTNPDGDAGVFDFAVDLMTKDNLLGDPIGQITDARMKELRDQLVSIGLLKSDFDYTKTFTTKFEG